MSALNKQTYNSAISERSEGHAKTAKALIKSRNLQGVLPLFKDGLHGLLTNKDLNQLKVALYDARSRVGIQRTLLMLNAMNEGATRSVSPSMPRQTQTPDVDSKEDYLIETHALHAIQDAIEQGNFENAQVLASSFYDIGALRASNAAQLLDALDALEALSPPKHLERDDCGNCSVLQWHLMT